MTKAVVTELQRIAATRFAGASAGIPRKGSVYYSDQLEELDILPLLDGTELIISQFTEHILVLQVQTVDAIVEEMELFINVK